MRLRRTSPPTLERWARVSAQSLRWVPVNANLIRTLPIKSTPNKTKTFRRRDVFSFQRGLRARVMRHQALCFVLPFPFRIRRHNYDIIIVTSCNIPPLDASLS